MVRVRVCPHRPYAAPRKVWLDVFRPDDREPLDGAIVHDGLRDPAAPHWMWMRASRKSASTAYAHAHRQLSCRPYDSLTNTEPVRLSSCEYAECDLGDDERRERRQRNQTLALALTFL